MQRRYREKEMIKSIMKRYDFFICLNFEWLFFVFEKMFSLIPLLFVMLLVHVGKRSNSCSQMFSKTRVLINFAIFTVKNLCWSLSLIKFQDWRSTFSSKKRLQCRCFSVNIGKFLRTSFLLKACSLQLFEIFIWW